MSERKKKTFLDFQLIFEWEKQNAETEGFLNCFPQPKTHLKIPAIHEEHTESRFT